jgi:hypothetical protein
MWVRWYGLDVIRLVMNGALLHGLRLSVTIRRKERKGAGMTDERYSELQAKLERDFPGINDPTSERYYYARLSGNEWKRIIEADRVKTELWFARYVAKV